jgi:putative ubiquitin-RnfH superfamily antitoxin RatB of RatAB toxin-antitoxin module
MDNHTITIEVVYGLAHKQKIMSLTVASGCSIREAAVLSRMDDHFDNINLNEDKLGIFGKTVRSPETELVKEGDRIEIYRPLLIDPKAARVNRAEKAKKNGD